MSGRKESQLWTNAAREPYDAKLHLIGAAKKFDSRMAVAVKRAREAMEDVIKDLIDTSHAAWAECVLDEICRLRRGEMPDFEAIDAPPFGGQMPKPEEMPETVSLTPEKIMEMVHRLQARERAAEEALRARDVRAFGGPWRGRR